MMTKFTNPYTQKVYEILLPLMGNLMAQSVIKIQTVKIGRDTENLKLSDMAKLAESIKSGIVIFLGSDAANSIATKIATIT